MFLEITPVEGRMFFGLFSEISNTTGCRFGYNPDRGFCSNGLPEFQLDRRFNDFAGIHWLFGDAENFHGDIQQ